MADDIYGDGAGTAVWRPLDRLLHALLPAPCLGCGRPLPARRAPLGLCAGCRARLRPLAAAGGCAVCALPLPGLAGWPEPAGTTDEEAPAGFVCGRCRQRPPAFARLVAGWSYEPPLDAVVQRFKFGRLDYLGGHLGRALAGHLLAELAAEVDGAGLVVPVPLHWRRRLARGFDQAHAIAAPLAAAVDLPLVTALRRRRATPAQSGLGRAERLANPRGAFAVRRPAAVCGRRLLLVDDVATTGATLDAAARALRRAGAARVVAVVAARALEPRRHKQDRAE